MQAEWRQSTWGDEITLEYGKGIRGYGDKVAPFRVFGSNGPIGWASEFLAPGPGVILGRKGAYRGVRYSKDPFFVIDTAYYVVPKTDLDMRWLYYAIIHHKLGEIDDGSPIPSTTRSAVYVRDLEVPPIDQQRAIAAVLGAMDDKIDLNTRTNETLQAMARAVFQEWFVDFAPTRAKMAGLAISGPSSQYEPLFPDSFDDGGLPRGWSRTTLAKTTSKIGSGATPRGGKEVYVDAGVSFIRSQNVYDYRFDWNGLVRIGEADSQKLRNVAVEPNDILINITGDSILRTCVVDPNVLPARVNQHVAIVRATDDMPPRFLHFYLALPSTKSYLLGNDAGGSRAAVTKGHLELLPVLRPAESILQAFQQLTEPWFELTSTLEFQSRTLAQLRDMLLPRLVSGSITVEGAVEQVGKVL